MLLSTWSVSGEHECSELAVENQLGLSRVSHSLPQHPCPAGWALSIPALSILVLSIPAFRDSTASLAAQLWPPR